MTPYKPIAGMCDPKFSIIRQAFEENFRQYGDIGGAVAVYHQRKPVVDLWGGYADSEQNKPWQRDTIVNVWSVTKAIVALCALRLVDRGELDLDAPVASYWQEFAQAGKELIPVRYLLNHQAGLAAIAEPLPAEAVFDWQRMTAALVKQRPWWTPGTAHGYHPATFGWLVGEVVRRVSGKPISLFLQDESEVDANRRVEFDPAYPEAELTYALGRDYWQQGYANEMGKALIAYGFAQLGLGRIIQGVLADNDNTINLMRRLGFRIEKGLRPSQVVGILDNTVYRSDKS